MIELMTMTKPIPFLGVHTLDKAVNHYLNAMEGGHKPLWFAANVPCFTKV